MTSEAARPRGASAALECALVLLVAFGLFAPTLPFELVWDDLSLQRIVEQRVQASGLGGLLTSEFQLNESEHIGYFRPVVLLSLWLDGRLAPLIPWAYHLTNVLLHALNSLLVLLLLRRLVGVGGLALAGALLFAVHPVHTEAVAFVSGRTDLWASFFVLLSTLFWWRANASSAKARAGFFVASLAALLLGSLSKESSLVLPAALLLLDGVLQSSKEGWWARNRWWLVGWLFVLGLAIGLRLWAGVPFGASRGADAVGRDAMQIVAGLLLHLRLLVLPWPLSAYYSEQEIRLTVVSSLAAAVLLFGGLALSWSPSRRLGFAGLGWILVFLLPVLGLVPISGAAVADRFLYLPSFGVALLAAVALKWISSWSKRKEIVSGVFAGLLVVLAFASVRRASVWRNHESLFSDLSRSSPSYVAMENNKLALKMVELGQHAAAVGMFREAVALHPESTELHNNLAVTLAMLGRHEEALAEYREAERLGDRRPELYVAKGYLCLALGRAAEAVEAFSAAVSASPNSVEAHHGLGRALLLDRRPAEALAESARLEALDAARAAALRQEIEAR